ncbi:MAG TPA: phosphohydrolase, partial [Stenomitos sp.]
LMYHLQRWCKSEDEILSDLCCRYRDRNLFKAQDISHHNLAKRETLYRIAQAEIAKDGQPPDYYVGLQCATTRGYTLYQRGIQIQADQTNSVEISEVSPLVQTLIQPLQRAWLIYPREIQARLPND